MPPLELSYPEILATIGSHRAEGRTDSRAFLGWFLENYFRLDPVQVEDSLCDGPDDRGIDGLYSDIALETIFVFQAKLFQNNDKTIGDATLREFAGGLLQFRTPEAVNTLASATGNPELKGLLQHEEISARVASGFEVKGVLVTNVLVDSNGEALHDDLGNVTIYDWKRLQDDWIPLGDTEPVKKEISFNLDGFGHLKYETPEAIVYVVSLRATELVQMAGIENQALFAWNVRQALGRTKVNLAIAENVNTPREHRNFMLYHNGLTILATDVALDDPQDRLTIDRYSVVNGAQSLSTLYERRASVSDDLRLLGRIIKLNPESDLAAMITRNSNNQNAIGPRDLQSNSRIQKRLKEDFRRTFDGTYEYEIKRGECSQGGTVITNEDAAKVLLAFDLEQPWACHQAYRYFDDLHSNIFGRPEVTASRIVALIAVRDAVGASLRRLESQLVARYSVTPYFVMYMVKKALLLDDRGRDFCSQPDRFLNEGGFERLVLAIQIVANDLIIDLNGEVKERESAGSPFDHKRELKSANAVRSLQVNLLNSYQKALFRGRASSFAEEWAKLID